MSQITTLSRMQSLEPTQSTRWNFDIIEAPTAVGSFPTSDDANLRVETTELPKKTGADVETTLKGHTMFSPGIYRPAGPLSVTFVEMVDTKILQWLAAWQQACWNDDTGARALTANLKATIGLTLLDNANKPIYEFQLLGCYLSDSDLGSLDGSNSEAIKPALVITWDDLRQKAL